MARVMAKGRSLADTDESGCWPLASELVRSIASCLALAKRAGGLPRAINGPEHLQ